MILYIKNPKDSINKTIRLSNEFSEVSEQKINIQKSVVFLHAKNKLLGKKSENNSIYNIIKNK